MNYAKKLKKKKLREKIKNKQTQGSKVATKQTSNTSTCFLIVNAFSYGKK